MTPPRSTWLALLLVGSLLAGCELLADDMPHERAVTAVPATATATPTTEPRAAVQPGTARQGPRAAASATPSPTKPATPAASPSASPSPTATSTPGPAPSPRPAAEGYSRYTSTLHPYSVDYPQAWKIIAGGATAGEAKADVFAGDEHDGALTSVTVYAQPVPKGTTSRFFLDASLAELAGAGIMPGPQQAINAGDAEAFTFSYPITSEDRAYQVTQAVFVDDAMGWVITLSSAPGEAQRLQPVLHHMLASLQTWR